MDSTRFTTLYIVLLIVTVFKGLVIIPSSYGLAQWLLNYSQGFTKRGLVGTILLPVLIDRTGSEARGIIFDSAFLVTGVFVLLACREVADILKSEANARLDSAIAGAAALALSTSPMFIVTGLSVGYYDALIASLLLLAIPRGALVLWRFAPLAVAALLVHELAAFLVVPMLLLYPLGGESRHLFDGRRALGAAVLLVAFAGLTLLLVNAHPSLALVDRMRGIYDIGGGFFDLQSETIVQHVTDAFRSDGFAHHCAEGLVVYMAPTWSLVGIGLWRLNRVLSGWRPRVLWSLAFVVSAMGSALSAVVATDYARMFALTNLHVTTGVRGGPFPPDQAKTTRPGQPGPGGRRLRGGEVAGRSRVRS